MVAEVIINRTAKKLNKTFDYGVPEELKDLITIGSKVLVPFGKGEKLEEAFVVKIKEKTEYEVKQIKKLEDTISDKQIELAKWMAKRYFCNVSDCIKLMLTPGTRNREKKIQDKKIQVVYLKKSIEEIEFNIETGKIKSEKQKRILNFVKNNEGFTIPEIEMLTDCSRAIIKTLVKNEYLEILDKKIERDPLKNKQVEKTNSLKLTEEQEKAYRTVKKTIEENKYKQFLLYGITGSRKNRSISTINTKSYRKRKNSNSISTRNIINTTNARKIYIKIWKRKNSHNT